MHDLDPLWSALARTLLPVLSEYRRDGARLKRTRKADGTLVTDADLSAQELILAAIADIDASAPVISEELAGSELDAAGCARAWIVDPIDGTSQFVDPTATEFCSVVALLEYGRPTGCMVLAPELGAGRTPLLLTVSPPDGRVHVDGVVAAPAPGTGAVSATRSSRRPPGAIERAARSRGIAVKTRATSQTLDMARTVLDLEPVCGIASFRAFVAEGQLVWDAAAGLALAAAMGRSAIDAAGRPLVPLAGGALAGPAPRLASTIVAEPRDQAWMLASR